MKDFSSTSHDTTSHKYNMTSDNYNMRLHNYNVCVIQVCEKVKSKGVTTYLEVSEELVEEFSHQSIVNSTPSSANVSGNLCDFNFYIRFYSAVFDCQLIIVNKSFK